jgi:hypothetical protein
MSIINLPYFSDVKDLPKREADDGAICIANISPLERQKRLRFGITQFIISLVVLSALIVFGVDRLWRLPLLFLFWAAAVGYFQARDKT